MWKVKTLSLNIGLRGEIDLLLPPRDRSDTFGGESVVISLTSGNPVKIRLTDDQAVCPNLSDLFTARPEKNSARRIFFLVPLEIEH